jgi:putative FmdB family regulatory protein
VPTYDYQCENGHEFEAFQSMKEEPLAHCVQCGANVRRLIGPGAGFIFKGGGFYQTEYRSKDYKDKAKAESSGATPAPAAETPKSSETAKPAAAKESKAGDSKGTGSTGGGGTPSS